MISASVYVSFELQFSTPHVAHSTEIPCDDRSNTASLNGKCCCSADRGGGLSSCLGGCPFLWREVSGATDTGEPGELGRLGKGLHTRGWISVLDDEDLAVVTPHGKVAIELVLEIGPAQIVLAPFRCLV